MLKPILDSTGTPVRSSTKLLSQVFNQRNTPMMSGPPGKSLLSGFAAGSKGDKFGLKNAGYSRFASDVEMANPSIRSPLLNQSNFYMPESDSSTGEPNRLLNQWISYYFKWNPIVGNVIDMHSELPLSRFALRGIEDPEILHFYEEMVESMELHTKMIELLRQYFLFGEVAPFAFWSDEYNCFTDMTFLDINYLYVKGHYLLHSDDGDDVEFYELEPDMMLQQIVKSDDYVTRQLRDYLDEDFIASVRNNKRLLLSNFSTHMIKHKTNYSDLRGTSIVLRCLKSLLYGDKLREAQYCYSPDTEVLTKRGFISIVDVVDTDMVATIDPKTFEIIYNHPTEILSFDYDGDMYDFQTRRVDVSVTPNHRMLVKGSTGDWKIVRADKVKKTQKVRATANWKGWVPKTISFAGQNIPTKTLVEFAGYYVSEGSISHTKSNRGYQIQISQSDKSPDLKAMGKCLAKLPFNFRRSTNGWFTYNKELYYAIKEMFGKTSRGKKLPAWLKTLSPKLLQIFLDAAIRGDGHDRTKGQGIHNLAYATICKRLADDVQEVAFKCGYAASLRPWKSTTNGNTIDMYSVRWSSRKTEHYTLSKDEHKYDKRYDKMYHTGKHVNKRKYKGKVYCLTVPNGLFVSRRNGKIGIHGNSIADSHINPKWIWKLGQAGDLAQGGYMPSEDDLDAFRELLIQANNDPIFTIITHYAVNVEAVGLNGKLLPTKEELKYITEEVLMALFSNSAVTTGTGPNFATASVAFRAMMSRYIPIRAKVERYLYQKIFAPVAYANKFYKRKQADLDHGVRTNQGMNELIIPQIDWRSKANLLDDGSVKSIIAAQVNSGKLPMRLLTEALDLDYDEAQNYLFSEQGTVFDPVAVDARKKKVAENTDQTLMGQPFLPKTNSPVTVPEVEPMAKAASKDNGNGNGKKKAADRLLTIQPLTTEKSVQTKIDQGKPEVGGDPEIPDPMAKALELKAEKEKETKDNKIKPRVFALDTGKNKKKLSKKLVEKQFGKRAETHETSTVINAKDDADVVDDVDVVDTEVQDVEASDET